MLKGRSPFNLPLINSLVLRLGWNRDNQCIFVTELNDEKNLIYTSFGSIDRQSAGVLFAQQLFAGAKTAHPSH